MFAAAVRRLSQCAPRLLQAAVPRAGVCRLSTLSAALGSVRRPAVGCAAWQAAGPVLAMRHVPQRGLKTARRQIRRSYRQKTKYKLKTRHAIKKRFLPVGNHGLKYKRAGRNHNSSAKRKSKHKELRRNGRLQGTMLKKYLKAINNRRY